MVSNALKLLLEQFFLVCLFPVLSHGLLKLLLWVFCHKVFDPLKGVELSQVFLCHIHTLRLFSLFLAAPILCYVGT